MGDSQEGIRWESVSRVRRLQKRIQKRCQKGIRAIHLRIEYVVLMGKFVGVDGCGEGKLAGALLWDLSGCGLLGLEEGEQGALGL